MKTILKFSIIILITTLSLSRINAQSNDVCLDCHNDPSIEMEKNGRTISIYVNKFVFMQSAHGKQKCVSCHKGFNPDEFPHKANITPINCKECHQAPMDKHIFHPQLAMADGVGGSPDLNCKGCHGTHEIKTSKSPTSPTNFFNSTNYCGKCHTKEREDHLKSVHFVQLQKNNPDAPTCIYCHSHKVTPNWKLDMATLKKNQEDLCLGCHLTNAAGKSQFAKTLINYKSSVHGQAIARGNANAAICTDCHGTHDLERASSPTSKINRRNVPNICSKCHLAISQEYKISVHGIALTKGNPDAPTCSFCHGEHNINPVVEAPRRMFSDNQINPDVAMKTKMVYCVVCHANETMMAKYNILTTNKAHEWLPALAKHYETVRCVDCHSSYAPPNLSHNILPPTQTVKKCEECHNENSVLMSKLYKHEKTLSRQKYGFINGTLLSDAYVVGSTRNVFLDSLSLIVFGVVLIGLLFHALMRWYFYKGK